MAPEPAGLVRVHGALVQVEGVGLLLRGRSGIGKSECALELVTRGHRFVADDVVLLRKDEEGRLVGWSPELVRHYIELRGIGIVHVPSLFGKTAVADRAHVDLAVHLVSWRSDEVERLGLDRQTEEIAGVEVAALRLPVAPGRNVASLLEVAARNLVLQRSGRSGVAELDDRVAATLRRRGA
jgi:HPr kinase/phosphorylase